MMSTRYERRRFRREASRALVTYLCEPNVLSTVC